MSQSTYIVPVVADQSCQLRLLKAIDLTKTSVTDDDNAIDLAHYYNF